MNKLTYPHLNETLYTHRLANGLTIAVIPKPGFVKKSAYFATDYGSIHMDYTLNGQHYTTPAGVAHYLEHKMFDLPGRDVMEEFAALGASPNAFTTYDMTAYYFSCTENFMACLELLLTFVSTPYFTQESVEKERGIIAQEIRMYEDSADSKVYEDLFAAMYRNHPVRIPIAGTVESIEDISAQTLMDCYNAFYHPGNMILCVVGDVEPETVVELAERILPKEAQDKPVADLGTEEDLDCRGCDTSRVMDVAMPTFQMGFKCHPMADGDRGEIQQIIGDLAAEALMGESSSLYQRLYQAGLIDGSFACGFEDVPGLAMLSCGGDSRDPEAVRQAILEEAGRLCQEGIDEGLFLRLKKSALGRRYRALDSFDSLCFRVCATHFDGANYFDFPKHYESVTKSQVEDFLRTAIVREHCAMSIIWPRQEEEN